MYNDYFESKGSVPTEFEVATERAFRAIFQKWEDGGYTMPERPLMGFAMRKSECIDPSREVEGFEGKAASCCRQVCAPHRRELGVPGMLSRESDEDALGVSAPRALDVRCRAEPFALARTPRLYNSNSMDDMEDEEDDDASTATGPILRRDLIHSHYSGFRFTVGPSSARRNVMKTPGGDDDDEEEVEDDAVNPSPLFHRRRAQYKSTAPSLSAATRRRISSGGTSRSPAMPRYASPTSSPPIAALFENPRATAAAGEDEDPRKAFLRERLRRQEAEGGGFGGGESDGEMEEEGDEALLNDVLFARIMANHNEKQERAYRISYAREVGSSFDPDLEDVSRWEQELSGAPLPPTSFSPSHPSSTSHHHGGGNAFSTNGGGGSSPPRAPTEYEHDGDGYWGGGGGGRKGKKTLWAGEEAEEDFVGLDAEEYARAVEGREGRGRGGFGVWFYFCTGAQQQGQDAGVGGRGGQGQDVGNLLEGLEDLPEEELFGVWNWDEGDEMDLS
ncbi:hypothetical protein DFP72DRAFT_1066717 [Ephemerocybe angulata]|uniref:Uncharacterized protein n=1 Tax=Ephemerocybe angulata TaxID=980116 RepID=A0A8H6M9T3_9AGAR|nr:hypothetical protein DFP72DRAFT_1066717 [Tulosesus angulatus]